MVRESLASEAVAHIGLDNDVTPAGARYKTCHSLRWRIVFVH